MIKAVILVYIDFFITVNAVDLNDLRGNGWQRLTVENGIDVRGVFIESVGLIPAERGIFVIFGFRFKFGFVNGIFNDGVVGFVAFFLGLRTAGAADRDKRGSQQKY